MITNKYLLILLSIIIVVTVSQSTVSEIVDVEATFINSYFDSKRGNDNRRNDNYGSSDRVELSSTRVGLVRFSKIFEIDGGPVPDSAEIINATFTVTTDRPQFYAQIRKATAPWSEDSVTWNIYTSSGGSFRGSPFAELKLVSSEVVKADVTSYFRDLVASNFTNDFGWSIHTSTSTQFISDNDSDQSKRPSLSVEWFVDTPTAPPTTLSPTVPVCRVGNLVCRCSTETEFDCTGAFNGTVILPQYEIIWTNSFVTTNTSIIIFGTNTTVVLETCHDIKGSIRVDFQLERGEESVLVKHNDGCSLDDIDVIFNDGNCIKGRTVQRGTSLVAVFDHSCSGQTEGSSISVPMVIGVILAIVVVIAILAFVFLYPPARSFVMPFSKQTRRTTPKELDDDQL